MHEATRRAREQWAAQNGVASRSRLHSAATGGSAAAEDAGADGPGCCRRQEPAKCVCGALDREEGLCATRQAHCRRVTEL